LCVSLCMYQPDLAPDLFEAVTSKFGDDFSDTVVKFLSLQGVETNPDLKHLDATVLLEQVKDAGAKPIQLGKLKDWVQVQSMVLPQVAEKPAVAEPPPPEETSSKKKKPAPKRETRAARSNSANDVTPEEDDSMSSTLEKRFGEFYGEVLQSFLMTQGVMNEDDLMVRDDLKMLATAKNVGVKPVQVSKLQKWMAELKELGNAPTRPVLPHERQGSKLKLTKDKAIPSEKAKDYNAGVRQSRASKDFDGTISL